MKEKAFSDMREQAITLFNTQPPKAKEKISLDTIFLSLVLALSIQGSIDGIEKKSHGTPAKSAQTRTGRDAPPEEWFHDALAKLKNANEKSVTIERFLLVAGRFPLTRMDRLNAARWLRELGHIPRKSVGNLIFDL